MAASSSERTRSVQPAGTTRCGRDLRHVLASSPIDLFGNPNPDYRPPTAEAVAPRHPGLTDAAVAAFNAAGLEVCFLVPGHGEVWLVSQRTRQDRVELTAGDLVRLGCGQAVFDGTRLVLR